MANHPLASMISAPSGNRTASWSYDSGRQPGRRRRPFRILPHPMIRQPGDAPCRSAPRRCHRPETASRPSVVPDRVVPAVGDQRRNHLVVPSGCVRYRPSSMKQMSMGKNGNVRVQDHSPSIRANTWPWRSSAMKMRSSSAFNSPGPRPGLPTRTRRVVQHVQCHRGRSGVGFRSRAPKVATSESVSGFPPTRQAVRKRMRCLGARPEASPLDVTSSQTRTLYEAVEDGPTLSTPPPVKPHPEAPASADPAISRPE